MFVSPVLRVFTTSLESNFDQPWQRQRPQSGTGSGVYLGEQLILTGAHVVNEATFIQVQSLNSARKVVAELHSICHDADLALLKVEDQDLLSKIEPAQIGDLPQLKDRVEVVGFPTGGDQVSVTNGVVSRIDVVSYSYSWRNLLGVTIDAAINPGNSGGPVFNRQGQVVGIAFQKNTNAENSGQMIPPNIIKSFLKEAKSGHKVVSIPLLGIRSQTLENNALKAHFQVPDDVEGILITHVDFGSPAYGILEAGDVLQQINEYEISCLGTIQFLGQYRTRISAILSECVEGDMLRIIRRRNGELSEVNITLKQYKTMAPATEGLLNRYHIFAGLVFQPLSRKYLQTWKSARHAPVALQYYYGHVDSDDSLQEVVVLSQVLDDEVNVGYSQLKYHVISEVNGIKVRDLIHLVELIEASKDHIEFKTSNGKWLMLNGSLAEKRHPLILERYHIPNASVL